MGKLPSRGLMNDTQYATHDADDGDATVCNKQLQADV